MKTKNSAVVFLLLHAVVINGLLFPSLFVYSIINKVNYLSFNQWTFSICINIIAWQILSYSLRKQSFNGVPVTLKTELKKFNSLVMLNIVFIHVLSNKFYRHLIFKLIIWILFLMVLFLPFILQIILGLKFEHTSLGPLFISFQFVTFATYYLNSHFPQDLKPNEKPLSTPWVTEVLLSGLSEIKLYK